MNHEMFESSQIPKIIILLLLDWHNTHSTSLHLPRIINIRYQCRYTYDMQINYTHCNWRKVLDYYSMCLLKKQGSCLAYYPSTCLIKLQHKSVFKNL